MTENLKKAATDNPNTTILGILALVSAIVHGAIQYYTDGTLDFTDAMVALLGVLGIASADGGK